MSQSTTSQVPGKRCCRLSITIQSGTEKKRYGIVVLRNLPADTVRAYELRCHTHQQPYPYTVQMDRTGAITCDCPAGQHNRPCKHIPALIAATLFNPEEFAALESARLDLMARRHELDQAEARAGSPDVPPGDAWEPEPAYAIARAVPADLAPGSPCVYRGNRVLLERLTPKMAVIRVAEGRTRYVRRSAVSPVAC